MANWNKYQDFEWRLTRIVKGSTALTPKGSASLQVRFENGIKHMIVDSTQAKEDFEFLALWIRLGSPNGLEFKREKWYIRLLNWWKGIGLTRVNELNKKKYLHQKSMDELISDIGTEAEKTLSFSISKFANSFLEYRISVVNSIFFL